MIAILAQSEPFFRTGNVLAWVLGAVLLLFVVLVLVMLKFINLWVQAYMSGTKIGLFQLVGMSLRKVNPTVIVRAAISATQAGLPLNTRDLEAHYLAGGRVLNVVQALIAADRANLNLDFKMAAAIDLAGRDVLDAVQTCVNPKVIDCPQNAKVAAMAMDGIQVMAKARVTVRTNIERLVGGATEETIIARVGEGIVTTPQQVALLDSRKSITFSESLKVPVLGVVENMSGFTISGTAQPGTDISVGAPGGKTLSTTAGEDGAFSFTLDIFKEGGGKATAEEFGVPFLGALPFDPGFVRGGDDGVHRIVSEPEGASAQAFAKVVDAIQGQLNQGGSSGLEIV